MIELPVGVKYGTVEKEPGIRTEVLPKQEAEAIINNSLTKHRNHLGDNQFEVYDDDLVELLKAAALSKTMKTELFDVKEISRQELKTIVKLYYQLQKYRRATREQIRSIAGQNKELNVSVLDWALKNMGVTEGGCAIAIEGMVASTRIGRWLTSIKGIGPILAGNLIANFDVEGKLYAGQFVSYAGLNDNNRPWLGATASEQLVNSIIPARGKITDEMVAEIAIKSKWKYSYLVEKAYDPDKGKWKRAEIIKAVSKIPYNKELKCLMFKVGSSFQWLCNKKDSLYGMLYSERRAKEIAKNEAGEYADQAAEMLTKKKFKKNTPTYASYSKGKLPPAHINARASRWVQKIFISHLFVAMYICRYNKMPPQHYVFEYLGESHNREIMPEVPYPEILK